MPYLAAAWLLDIDCRKKPALVSFVRNVLMLISTDKMVVYNLEMYLQLKRKTEFCIIIRQQILARWQDGRMSHVDKARSSCTLARQQTAAPAGSRAVVETKMLP